MKRLQKRLEETNKKTFLDIGTGAGNYVHQITSIYDKYDSFIGIDIHKQAIEVATKNAPNDKVTFEHMDAYQMSYPDKHFDVVCLSNSLHHLKDIPGMFEEMARVLKDDGFILIQEMIKDQLNDMQESHRMMHHFAAKIDRVLGDTHNETYDQREIIDILNAQNGLRVDQDWILDVPHRQENSQEELDYIYNILDRVMARVPEDHKDEFSKERDTIKEYISKHGYDGCPSVCAVIQKTSL